MSIERIKAVILQELFITKRSLEVIMDLFFFSVVSILVFGLVSVFISQSAGVRTAQLLLIGLLLWEIIRITQYSMSVGALWNIWSRNLSNMFIAPLTLAEYMIAQMISGIIKSLFIFLLISTITILIFHFNIFNLGLLNLAFFFMNLTIFSWSLGIVLLGVIFRFGTRIQALAWGTVFIFQPLTAAFFPVKILPSFLQNIAYLFPPTYVFEAARGALSNQSINWQYMLISLLENLIYFAASLWFFNLMFKKSKQTGQFSRNEG